MAARSIFMRFPGGLSKALHIRWMEDYALPLSLVAGMASAIPFTTWLG